jgi:alpha-glucosidase
MEWWQDAVVYQTYLRSFADADGDGIGDLGGLVAKLPYLQRLGVDAIWLNPCYTSPQHDHGYDIADYFDVDPVYGSLHDFDALIQDAHRLGIRVLMDMVANHCSTEHRWFAAAVAGGPGTTERARFHFADGRGEQGELPPNNWQSVFGGPAWTRVVENDGAAGQWYLHSFDSSQPDFNWRNDEVVEYFDEVLRFWYYRGVDGFRIDVAHGMFKSARLADWPGADDGSGGHNFDMWDQPEVHGIYRRWRAIAESYAPKKYYVGEVWVPNFERLASYLAQDELHQAFSFDLLVQPWHAPSFRGAIERGIEQAHATGQVPAWTLSNHDVHRPVTRYGQEQDLSAPLPHDMLAAARRTGPVDVDLGIRRARAAVMLQLALPGSKFLYQGEELGLPEVFDLPDSARQDPIWLRSVGAELGRDGCRVPLPWNSAGRNFGFSDVSAVEPAWLPQPEWFASFLVERQDADDHSTLALYRQLIARRREFFRADAPLAFLDSIADDTVAFRRGAGICVVNFGTDPVRLPDSWKVTQAVVSDHNVGGDDLVPPNSAAWFLTERVQPHPSAIRVDGVFEDSPSPQLQQTAR